jgi:hypothetical protein
MKYKQVLLVDFNHFAEAIKQLGLYWLILNHRSSES